MVKIVRKKVLNPSVTLLEVEAPLIAKKARAGQFIILRVDEHGERIPLTIADYDRACPPSCPRAPSGCAWWAAA